MSGFSFNTGFGASQGQSPFGSTAPSPFGAPQSVFGQTGSSPFGASTSGGLFGTSTPAFGAPQTPAFGATSSAFGSTAFGAKPAGGAFGGFGQSLTTNSSPFGSSQPAFGAPQSTPAFGAQQSSPGFGAQPFGNAGAAGPFGGGGGAIGAPTPAFGSTAFGAASTPAFGSTGFGTGFGQQAFGVQPQQQQGTQNVSYQKVGDTEGAGTGTSKTTVYFCSINAMPQFQPPNEKSAAELRWEDYQAGVKGNTGAAGPTGGGLFGQATPGFGTPQGSSPFGGGAPAFGQASTPAFGQASTPAFGQASTPAFGSTFGQSSAAFGSSTPSMFGKPGGTPAFGQSSSPFGGSSAFGSTPAFGQSSSAFGSSTSTFGQSMPAFGSTGLGSTFGSSTSAFGAPQSSSAFGGGSLFGSSTSSGFSFNQQQSSTPSFSFASSTPAFGQSAATPGFSASGGGFNFGQASSSPAFGSTGLFGQAASKPFGSTFGASQPFGGSAPTSFSAGGSLFGTPASSPAFGGNIFGGQQSGGSSLFNFAQQPQQQQQQTQNQMGPVQLPGVATSPYGTLPAAPQIGGNEIVTSSEYKVGISQRPVSGLLSSRTMALMAPRNITPRAGLMPRSTGLRSRTPRRMADSPADILRDTSADASSSIGSPSIFVARDNPRQFFIRDYSLPSTEAPLTTSTSPSMTHTPRGSTEDQATSNGEHVNGLQRGRSPANGTANKTPPRPSSAQAKQQQQRGSSNDVQRLSDDDDDLDEPGKKDRRQIAHQLTDEEISRLLPKVTQPSIYIEPSLTQLAAMARVDEQSLAAIANFKVGHRQYGSVQWREAVDVRGVDVDTAVAFSKGSVEVYFEDARKPEIGQGLNKPADVTLLSVYKMDKATGRPTTDQAVIDKFVKRLKSMAASQNARFIEYKADKGLWRFQVDHFSRYGLVEGSESDEEGEEVGPSPARLPRGKPPAKQQQSPQAQGATESVTQDDDAVGMQEGDEVEGLFTEDSDQGMDDDSEIEPLGLNSAAQRAAVSPILPHSLPASLALEPMELARMRDSLYPARGKGHPQRPSKRRTVEGETAPRQDSLRAKVGADKDLDAARVPAEAASRQVSSHTWVKPTSAILPLPKACQAGSSISGHDAAVIPEKRSCLVNGSGLNAAPQPRDLVDASSMMGHCFRVGWGPNNTFVHPGVLAGSSGKASSIVLRHLKFNAALGKLTSQGLEASHAALRARWQKLLQVHSESNTRSQEWEEHQAVPKWSLKCNRVEELNAFCRRFIAINHEQCMETKPEKDSNRELCLKHETQIWELMSVLYSDIPAEPLEPQVDGDADDEDNADQAMSPEPGSAQATTLLVAFKRRAGLSRWLRDRAKPEVEGGLQAGGTLLRKVALLLSGQMLPDAAALAAAAGNVRLATLIIQAGRGSKARRDLAAQMQLWQKYGLDSRMDPELLNIYSLLSADHAPVTAALSLEWHRAFGLHLWYVTSPDAPIEESVTSFLEAASGAKTAPDPLPLYADKYGWRPGQLRTADTAFTLLQLYTGHLMPSNPMDLAQLLSPEGHTPEPLDILLSWLLLQVLQAIKAVVTTPAMLQQEMMLAGDLIAQLHTIGGLPEWEVYVALHLPTHSHPDWQETRSQVVRQLLMRNASGWLGNAGRQEFLQRLGVPKEWIADALSVWAQYSGKDQEEIECMLEAEQWTAAHQLLVDKLAPAWCLAAAPAQQQLLRQCLQQLKPHQQAIAKQQGPNTFHTGAGLYLAYLALRDMHANAADNSEDGEAVQDLQQFTAQLKQAAASLPRTAPRDSAYYQVLAKMANDAARWLASARAAGIDQGAADWQAQTLQLTSLPPATRLDTLQLAVAGLAQAY